MQFDFFSAGRPQSSRPKIVRLIFLIPRVTYEAGGRVGVNGTLGTNRECELDLPTYLPT